MRAMTAARGARNVTKTCAPMKTTSPTMSRPMGPPASPQMPPSRPHLEPLKPGAIEAMARPKARRWTSAPIPRELDARAHTAFTLVPWRGRINDRGNADETAHARSAWNSARARAGGGAGLADQDGAGDRAVRPGLDPRHGGATDRRPHAAEARPVLRDRESSRRQRHDRDRHRGQGGARRLHHRR